MIKKAWIFAVLISTACVTVNVYFPAAAVQEAADKVVEETWGNPPKPSGQSRRTEKSRFFEAHVVRILVPEAHAQNTDINISNPPIRAIKEQMRQRSRELKPFLDQKNVGIDKNGYLEVLNTKGIGLRERSRVNQLVTAENRDRKALYAEIAKANNLTGETKRIEAIFANTWREKAEKGWPIQKNDGSWITK